MSRPHDGHRPFFPFGNHFKAFRSKGAYSTTKLITLQNAFEEALAEQLTRLKSKTVSDVLTLSWMKMAVSLLCEVHAKIKDLIADLKFPVSEWDEEWMDMYLDNSVKLLDLCNFFSSEISRHEQGLLLLRYISHVMNHSSVGSTIEERLKRIDGPLHEWTLKVGSRSTKLESMSSTLKSLTASISLPTKTKNLTKGKVLMRAMYGVKAVTVFICGVVSCALTGSLDLLMDDVPVSTDCLWSAAFNELRGSIHPGLRQAQLLKMVLLLNELVAVQQNVNKIITDMKLNGELLTANTVPQECVESLQRCVSEMGANTEKLAGGLELISKEVREFFHIVLTGRDALLCNLRTEGKQSSKNMDNMRF